VTRRQAISHRLGSLMEKAEQTFSHEGAVYLPKVVVTAAEDAWNAFAVKNYARTEHLIPVIEFLVARNQTKFQADPAKWVERQREVA
jgi:hypothetical protein